MVDVLDIQQKYQDLYKELRKYIWEFNVVELLVDLEISCFKTMPTLGEIHPKFERLRSETRDVAAEDEDLENAFEAFSELLNSGDEVFSRLNQVQEVIQ